MAFFVLAMLAYPETQARAYAELDAVVDRSRLPPSLTLHIYPTFALLLKNFYAGDQSSRLPRHIEPPRTTGTKGCSFPKGRFVCQTCGI